MSHFHLRRRLGILLGAAGAICLSTGSFAADLTIVLPLHRTAYQTNEWIDVSVVRSDAAALSAGTLTLALNGDDSSALSFAFPIKAIAVEGNLARTTEHLHLNGRLIRPGKYTIQISADGATASAPIEIYSHIRRSNFKLIDWGSSTTGAEQAVIGQDSMGFNLIYYTRLSPNEMIRGGADFMRNCTMSGAHQMDLRMECDWSDPYVLQGGEARVVAEALQSRTYPNCIGVHFYDEPGLTWWKDQGTMVPFNIPAQDRSYKSAFKADPPHWSDVKPQDPEAIARWTEMNRWKESFMEAAWKYAQLGVSEVRPDFISVTQSQYAWMAYADGYYFNVVRQLPVISGHGGYDDGCATYFQPSFFHEMGRARDLNKPVWYMPTWYGETSDQFRLEQYLSFITDLQGMAKPPDMKVQNPEKTPDAAGIVESNKLMARIGTIFTTMRPTRGEVAVLYSLSQDLGAEVEDMQDPRRINIAAYEGGEHVRARMLSSYLAGKMIHRPLWPIVEEDVLDGTLAANHKAVLLPGVNYLDPKVVAALEAYAAGGGTVLLSDDSKIAIKGAVRLGAEAPVKLYREVNSLWSTDQKQAEKLRRVEYWLKEVEPYARALEAKLSALGITPALDADSPSIITQRQAQGDIEYLLAVNATPKPDDDKTHIQSAEATLSIAADGRPVYDVVHSQLETEFKEQGKVLSGKFRFGPGEMRIFARTTRPIGSVQVMQPVLFRDFTVDADPIRVETAVALLDAEHAVLSGSAPLQLRLIDPLGEVRYDLYRAPDRGMLKIDLPLAANDPAGKWKIEARELLSGKESACSFSYQPATQCAAAAGATQRAVSFGNDRDQIFRLFRTHQDFTLVVGKGNYDSAAERIVQMLKPWGARCSVVKSADVKVNRPSDEELKTWAGLSAGRVDPKNLNAAAVGFNLHGPAILLGTPEDNELIKFASEHGLLPYSLQPEKQEKKKNDNGQSGAGVEVNFPGRGRGYIAWQRDAVSYGAESVTLIGYDAEGISEAVGSLYEAVAGIDPLTRFALPAPAPITPASTRTTPPEAKILWSAAVPDRVVSLKADDKRISVLTADGSLTELDARGAVVSRKESESPATPMPSAKSVLSVGKPLPGKIVKKSAASDGTTAVAYWGGALQIIDAAGSTVSVQMLQNDIGDLTWMDGELIVGLSDGTVQALSPK